MKERDYMNLFSKLLSMKNNISVQSENEEPAETPIPEEDKRFYQADSYYTNVVYPGTAFEKRVVTFAERKLTAIPSEHGLFVPEILMLSYSHLYPKPKRGYPGFWWFNYGIRNVGAVLQSLAMRGFLEYDFKSEKYRLTDLGRKELSDNEYVVFVHKNSKRTDYTAWEMNLEIGKGDKSRYKEIAQMHGIVDIKEETKERQSNLAKKEKLPLNKVASLNTIDKQIEAIQTADAQYKEDQDVEYYIDFWEKLWNSNGLLFNGSKWAFTLTDIYIKEKRYDDALKSLNYIRNYRFCDYYTDKIKRYEEKIRTKIKNTNKN